MPSWKVLSGLGFDFSLLQKPHISLELFQPSVDSHDSCAADICACMHACMYVHVCVCVSQVNIRCLPQ